MPPESTTSRPFPSARPTVEPGVEAVGNRLRLFWAGLAAAATLLACWIVGTRRWRIGIAGEWQWPYYETPLFPILLLPAAVFLGLLALLAAFMLRRGLRGVMQEVFAVCLALALALAGILSLGDAVANPYALYDSIVAPWAGGYYAESARIENMKGYLDHYDQMIEELEVNDIYRGHIADHPAGPVVFHWLANRAMEHWPAMAARLTPADADQPMEGADGLTPRRFTEDMAETGPLSDGEFAGIWASAFLCRFAFWLALPLVYLLARDLFSREAALIALALTAMVPALHLFGPYPDQVAPLLFIAALYTWHRALRTGGPVWVALSGLTSALGLLWTLALLAAPAALALWTIVEGWKRRRDGDRAFLRRWTILLLAWFGGFALASLLPTALFGYDTWRVWRICLTQHARFATLFTRSYRAWVLFNPVEFALFIGVPTAVLLAAALWFDIRRFRDKHAPWSPALWSVLGVLAALNFSGKNLGETGRLWMFLMPPAAVAASDMLERLDRRRGWMAAGFLLLAALQLLMFRMNLNVFKP